MEGLVQCIDKLIDDNWKLCQSGGRWQLKESNKEATNTLLEISGGQSVAFSLDRSGTDAFPFMRHNTVLSGMRSACDAIVVSRFKKGEPYVFLIEMKSNDEGSAIKQLRRSKLLWCWIENLLRMNGHCADNPTVCGVISFAPRKQERKGVTAKKSELPKPKNINGMHVFRLKNHPNIRLESLVKALHDVL